MLCLEIPNKTFVIGEYLALEGTASMLLSTEPCFKIKIQDGYPQKFKLINLKKLIIHLLSFILTVLGGDFVKSSNKKKNILLKIPMKGEGVLGVPRPSIFPC